MAAAPEMILPDWPASPQVRARVTTRTGGASTGDFASFNLGDHVGDEPAAVAANRARLRAVLELPAEPRWLRQVHGTKVIAAGQDAAGREADAVIASVPGEVCAVLTADCLPLIFCDAAGRHVAAAHAGWRGLAAGVLEATLGAFAGKGVAPQSLLVWIGPAIGAAAYEVGDDVRGVFLAADPAAADGFSMNTHGRWQLDLVAIARRRLRAAGVRKVFGGHLCTASDPSRFFSHRRDGRCGRQATLVWIV